MSRNVHVYPITGAGTDGVDAETATEALNGTVRVTPEINRPPDVTEAYVEFSAHNATSNGLVAYKLVDHDVPQEIANVTATTRHNATRQAVSPEDLVPGNELGPAVEVLTTSGSGGTTFDVEGHLVIVEHE